MKNYKSILPLLVLFVLVFGAGFGLIASAASTNPVLRDPNGLPAKEGATCETMTVTSKTVLASGSTQILATSSNRAYARIQIGNNATNTVFVAFNKDIAATVNTGAALNTAVTGGASSTPVIEFGIATPFPYTGAVTAVSNFGGAPILVTECVY